MSSERDEDVPVLVVGAGPAGLAAAITLARHGVGCLLVERRSSPSPLPRATGVSLRTMELLRSWGLEQEVRAGGVEVAWEGLMCDTLASAAAGSVFPVAYPSDAQAAVLSPTRSACVPQDHLERVLLRHLLTLPRARVAPGTEVTRVSADRRGVQAVLRDAATGATRTLGARFLVATDGAHSAVRTSLGIAMVGSDRLVDATSAVFRAPLWPVVGPHRHGLYAITHPEAKGSLLPAGRGDRWIYGTTWEPGQRVDRTPAEVTALIRLAAGVGGLPVRLERIGPFSFAAQLAERFRAGRVLLAGDAAHRVSPRGGTGMNIAIHGAYDLGWKLAWVLRGWAGPELLDTYEAERRPVAEHNIARSAQPDGSVRPNDAELPADLGGRIAHRWLPGPARRSTLDLLGGGLTLLTGPRRGGAASAVTRLAPGPPVVERPLDAMTARALGVPGDGGLLVRPDGVPLAFVHGGEPWLSSRLLTPSAPGPLTLST